MSKQCYWFSQGRCQLFIMEESMAFNILARVPAARESLSTCADEKCPEIDEKFLEFANNPRTLVEDAQDASDRFQGRVNRYRDLQKYIQKTGENLVPEIRGDEDGS